MGVCISLGYRVKKWCVNDANNDVSDKESAKLQGATVYNTPLETFDFKLAMVLDVHDGDTFKIAAMHDGKRTRFTVRLYGIDTPEMNSKDPIELLKAKNVTEYVRGLIEKKIVQIEVLTNTRVYDMSERGRMIKGKYGRLLAIVYVNGVSLTHDLISKGMGVVYFGGSKY
jgi:endonuclease YncB( thermonuclease family)